MPATKKAAKPKAPSSYTYTGCWTCRRRHIKCDEGKPSCQRCTKAAFECEGYGFRFGDAESSRSSRRPVALGRNTQPVASLTNAEVAQIIDDLDSATTSIQKGPFTVLAFGEASGTQQHTDDDAPSRRSSNVPIRLKAHDSPPLSPQDSGYLSSKSPSQGDTRELSPPLDMETPSASIVRQPHLLTVPPMQAELFEHWTSYLCNIVSPFAMSPANPFRHLYPTLALEGLMAAPEMAGSRLAVFHGICGTAAWNLSRMKPENDVYRTLSINHDQMALKYIQQTLENPYGLQDASIPAAIMTCLTGDTVSGRLDLWGQHLHGGFRCLLNVLARQKMHDNSLSSLCQQYLLCAAFANFGTSSQLRLLRRGILGEYVYIEDCHCITRDMVETLIAINHLRLSSRANDPVQIERVRMLLVHSVPQFREPSRHHISHAYYYAITIYFTRHVLGSPDTQELASSAISHLEWAQCAGQGSPSRVLMWLLFTIGPECTTAELRDRLITWCNRYFNIGNINHFIERLRQTWSVANLEHTSLQPLEVEELP